MQFTKEDILLLDRLSLIDGLKFITNKIENNIVFSTSLGQEDQIITDAIFKNNLPIDVLH